MEELNQYRILNELGSQKNRTFGKVYLIEQKETFKKAVLKHVKKAKVKKNIFERLRSEASFDFDVHGLPKTIYFRENETEIVLIKEFFEGIPLDLFWNTIAKKDRLSVLKSIFSQLSPLLQFLREESIAHCDLKPSNIIVNQVPNGLSVAIIDFGMAIRYPNKETRALLFPMGYAAPELLLNELALIDQRTDFYSLGICIWRLYENKLPLTHPNPSIFTNLQLNHPTPEGENIPKELMKLVMAMTSKYSFERPPNQLESRERLEKLKIGVAKRPKSFEEIVEKLNGINAKKWFFF